MAINSFNPFGEIFENKMYSDSRTLRTNLSQKMWDTFHVFAGKGFLLESEAHFGLFDYATLFLQPALLWLLWLCVAGLDSRNFFAKIFSAIAIFPVLAVNLVVNVPLFIARIAVSLLLTIVVSPIVTLTHLAASLFSRDWRKKALSLENDNPKGQTQNLEQYLESKKLSLENLDVTLRKVKPSQNTESSPSNSQPTYQLGFWRKATGPSSAMVCQGCLDGCDEEIAPFHVNIPSDSNGKIDHEKSKKIGAILRLNIGGSVTNIEDNNNGSEILNQCRVK